MIKNRETGITKKIYDIEVFNHDGSK